MVLCTRMTVLWAVNVNWNSDGWNVNANSVTDPNKWNEGNQVFSRNCYFLPLKWRKFYFQYSFSSHPTFFQFHLIFPKGQYIFYYLIF